MATTEVLEMVETTSVAEEQTMNLTSAAQSKLKQLLVERNIPAYGLRVFVAGGGCSGLQYGMAFEAAAREFDTVVDQGGVKLFIDPTSMMYLAGASVDYVDGLMGAGFKIENPNATASCGCGNSFRTRDSGSTESASGADETEEGCGSGCSCHSH